MVYLSRQCMCVLVLKVLRKVLPLIFTQRDMIMPTCRTVKCITAFNESYSFVNINEIYKTSKWGKNSNLKKN